MIIHFQMIFILDRSIFINEKSGIRTCKSVLVLCYLCGPQIEVSEGRQLDELLGAGAGHLREGQRQTLQVAEGAAAQQLRHVGILKK